MPRCSSECEGSRSKVPVPGPAGGRAARAGGRSAPGVRAATGTLRARATAPGPRRPDRPTAPGGPMTRADKEPAVAELVDSFQASTAAVLTEYRGLSVKQLQDLRRA